MRHTVDSNSMGDTPTLPLLQQVCFLEDLKLLLETEVVVSSAVCFFGATGFVLLGFFGASVSVLLGFFGGVISELLAVSFWLESKWSNYRSNLIRA